MNFHRSKAQTLITKSFFLYFFRTSWIHRKERKNKRLPGKSIVLRRRSGSNKFFLYAAWSTIDRTAREHSVLAIAIKVH